MEKEVQENTIETTIRNLGFADSHEFAKIQLTKWLKRQIEHLGMSPEHNAQFEQLLFALEKMPNDKLSDNEKINISRIVEKIGFSLEEYTYKEIKLHWQTQVAHYGILIAYYAHKYGTSTWEEASANFDNYPFGMIEKEDDLWNWEDAVDSLFYYTEKLNYFKNA